MANSVCASYVSLSASLASGLSRYECAVEDPATAGRLGREDRFRIAAHGILILLAAPFVSFAAIAVPAVRMQRRRASLLERARSLMAGETRIARVERFASQERGEG
jgi:hypothetical protein